MEMDEFTAGARFGYGTAWSEAAAEADRGGTGAILRDIQNRRLGVHRRRDGPKTLYCFDCCEWVSNTANYEMGREGVIAHSHVCAPQQSGSEDAP